MGKLPQTLLCKIQFHKSSALKFLSKSNPSHPTPSNQRQKFPNFREPLMEEFHWCWIR